MERPRVNSVPDTFSNVGVEKTALAIRERLMEYFKGGCVESMTRSTNINMQRTNTSSGLFFERREADNIDTRTVSIGGLPVLRINKLPDTIIFYEKTLGATEETRAIWRHLEKFTDEFLMGVKKTVDNSERIY